MKATTLGRPATASRAVRRTRSLQGRCSMEPTSLDRPMTVSEDIDTRFGRRRHRRSSRTILQTRSLRHRHRLSLRTARYSLSFRYAAFLVPLLLLGITESLPPSGLLGGIEKFSKWFKFTASLAFLPALAFGLCCPPPCFPLLVKAEEGDRTPRTGWSA